ncbi:MAG: MarR family transcriptional regulator, partial [Lentisphaeria bacterium]|nr:MarR family transcriptional regulator [Lentisphaeria bacterium]
MTTMLIALAILLIALALLAGTAPHKNDVHPALTEHIYAVPGLECSIYFNNIVTVINVRNYAFEVVCDIGRTDADRWRAVPEEKDIGDHKLTIRVYDENGLVSEGVTTVTVVSPVTKERELSLLLIGASQTAAVGYPERVYELMKKEENIRFSMVGTNSGGYTDPVPGGVAHEGYGGWGWNTFFTNWGIDESRDNDGLHPRRPWVRNSRFLFPDGDGFKFDFARYCQKYNQGKYPDTIVIALGINNVLCAKSDREVRRAWRKDIYPYMKKMVTEFRKCNPQVHIAFCTPTPGAWSQDAFGSNYQCSYTLWRWRLNHRLLYRGLVQAAKEFHTGIIPVHAVVDGAHGFPEAEEKANQRSEETVSRQINAVHPNPSGYAQIGDCVFAYLKHRCSRYGSAGAGDGPYPRTPIRNDPRGFCLFLRSALDKDGDAVYRMQRIDWVKKKMRLREPEIRDFNAARWGALPVSCFFHMPFLKMGTDIWHQHQDFYELVVVVDGTFWDEYPGGCDMLRAGNFFIYAPESVHHYRQMNNCRYYNVLFAADLENYTFLKRETLPAGLGQFLPDKGRRSALFSLGAANLAGIVAVLEDMCRENVTRQDGWKEMLISQLVRLLIHLRRCAEAPVPEPDATLAFTVEKAMDFMEKHMLEDLTLAQLKVLGVLADHYPEPMMVKEIAAELGQTPGAVSQMIDTLCHQD